MNNAFDFKWIKSQISIEQLLTAYGIDQSLKRKNDYLYGPCPIHNGDNATAFRVNLSRGVWHCFTACGGGDLVELVRRVERCSYAQAARSLNKLIDDEKLSFISPAVPHSKDSFKPFTQRLYLNPRVPFLQQHKKISVRTALHYEAGIAEKSLFLKNMTAVRLHDLKGNPLGYCGRRLNKEDIKKWGKWRFAKSFPKASMLFNAHRVEPFKQYGLIIVECPWAALRFAQAGIMNAVALLGTALSPMQVDWIIRAPRVIVFLDGDQAGRQASIKISGKIGKFTDVEVHNLADGLEPENLSDSQLNAFAKHVLSF